MRLIVAGLGILFGAVWCSRGSRTALGDFVPNDLRGKSLDRVQAAATELYPTVDDLNPRVDVLFQSDDYQPQCQLFNGAALEALGAAVAAADEGAGSAAVKAAAVQAWSLGIIECEREPEAWELRAVVGA